MAFQNLKGTGIGYLLGKLKNYLDATYQKIAGAVRSVNGNEPDEYGNVAINRVNLAGDLESSSSQNSNQQYIQRTSGGSASIKSGDAWLSILRGNSVHEGFVPETRLFTVNPADESSLDAEIDWDVFIGEVGNSTTMTFTYDSGWNYNPVTYGITVDGTPVDGDEMIVEYVKEERGTIFNATPTAFVSTGWNLYQTSGDYTGFTGYAKVVRYSDDYGYMVKGTRTGLQFSATLNGEKTPIVDVDGLFQVPTDGYVWVSGGSSANTAIYATWTDWTANYEGDFKVYAKTTVDLSGVMDEYFPNGLCRVESTYDEINISLGIVTVRIEQWEYTDENLALARDSGRAFEYDSDYIYIVKESASTSAISGLSGQYVVDDHGLEYFDGTAVAVETQTIYGANLKNKLERDVLTMSQQTMTDAQKDQVLQNIGISQEIAKLKQVQYIHCTATSSDNRLISAEINCFRSGNVVSMQISSRWNFSGTNFTEGDTVTITVSGHPKPIMALARNVSMHSARIMVLTLATNELSIREVKGTNASNNAPIGSNIVYITDDP